MFLLRLGALHFKFNTNNRLIGPSISFNLISSIFHVLRRRQARGVVSILTTNMESQCIYCVLSTLCGLGYFTVYCSNTYDYYYDTIHEICRCSSFTWLCRVASDVAISLHNWWHPTRICVFRSTRPLNTFKPFTERHISPILGWCRGLKSVPPVGV